MNQESDFQLIQAAAGGNRKALATLYDRYVGICLAVGCRILGSVEESEDIVHDAFLEVWRRAGTYDPQRASVRTWILLVVRSRALDRKRSAVMKTSVPFDMAKAVPLMAEKESRADRSDYARLEGFMQALPEVQRTVLELGYFHGLSSSEIATKLGIPVGTVKSRVAAALAKLRDAASDPSPESGGLA
jgi:RNA polymerase sigma-70 factor, ECF subfamily